MKLHDDTIRRLLIEKVGEVAGDQSVKQRIIEKIKDLPAEALGAVAVAGLDAGLSHAPDLLGV